MILSARSTRPTFISILWSFLKLSPFSFGGGYATFPAMERELVDKRQWLDSTAFAGLMSLASAAPGGVAVNAALLLGYKINKTPGLIAALIGVIVPPFLIVLSVFFFISYYGQSPKLRAALSGLTWGVMTLILYSAFRMGKKAIIDKLTFMLLLAGLILLFIGIPPVYLIISGIMLGIGFAVYKPHKNLSSKVELKQEDSAYMYFI